MVAHLVSFTLYLVSEVFFYVTDYLSLKHQDEAKLNHELVIMWDVA
jgi:hypothetical protein